MSFNELPDELIIKIFEYLNFTDNISCCNVNTRFYSISEDCTLWLHLLSNNTGTTNLHTDVTSYKNYYKQIYHNISKVTIYDFVDKQYIQSICKINVHNKLYDDIITHIMSSIDCVSQCVIFLIDKYNNLQSIVICNQNIKHYIILTCHGFCKIHNIVFIRKISQPYQNDLCYHVLDMWHNFVLLCSKYDTICIDSSNMYTYTNTNIRFIMLPLMCIYDESSIHITSSHLTLIFKNIEGCISFEIKDI